MEADLGVRRLTVTQRFLYHLSLRIGVKCSWKILTTVKKEAAVIRGMRERSIKFKNRTLADIRESKLVRTTVSRFQKQTSLYVYIFRIRNLTEYSANEVFLSVFLQTVFKSFTTPDPQMTF